MRIITWNINGIRAAMRKGFAEKLDMLNPDVICLQETKAQDEQVIEALKDIDGYYLSYNSAQRKGYSGTAILSRQKPISVQADIDMEEHDQEGRVQWASYEDFNLVNVYVPNSGSKLKRLDYRAVWDVDFANYLKDIKDSGKPMIVTGDFNVAHEPIDLARPTENYNKTAGYTQVEIDGFKRILDLGFHDIYRERFPDKQEFTFWNQRFRARERNVGWRIDYFLVCSTLAEKTQEIEIMGEVYGSDHCPVAYTI